MIDLKLNNVIGSIYIFYLYIFYPPDTQERDGGADT